MNDAREKEREEGVGMSEFFSFVGWALILFIYIGSPKFY